jgi:1A family penicillin-binding protein
VTSAISAISGLRWRDRFVYAFLIVASVCGLIVSAWVVRMSFAVHRLTRGVGDTMFYSADGTPWFRMDEHRHDVPLTAIAAPVQQAVVAIEDHRFYSHWGIDPVGFSRAVVRNVREADVVEGGSTITQQLARTLFLSNRRTYARKIKEAALALMIERELSKRQILELYLNRVYLGGGFYGVETTSRKLFGKPAGALSLPEAAMIAGLVRGPSSLAPWSNYEGAYARSHRVLRRMREVGLITAEVERSARRARPVVKRYPGPVESRAGYAKEYLRQQFRNQFGGDHPPDWQVHTTFVPELQDAAERAVLTGLQRTGQQDLQAALVALDPQTGNIMALVGGRDYRMSPFNRATRSRRQPGSAFKPIVYAAALDRGYTPVSILTGLTSVGTAATATEEEWRPRDANGSDVDDVTLRAGLLESNNRAAVALQQQIGSRAVRSLARDLGMPDMPDVASLALGTGLVTPLALTSAYAAFANGGEAISPQAITRVLDEQGSSAYASKTERRRVISPEATFQLVTMLQDVLERGTASRAAAYRARYAAGGKTGTTDHFKDAWFVGFTPTIVVGVWVGYDQPAPIGRDAYGARLALPIWVDFMRHAVRRVSLRTFAPPSDMRDELLCRITYLRPVDSCPTYTEYFKTGDAVPGRLCALHRGTLKQRVRREVEELFSTLGRRIRGIFR